MNLMSENINELMSALAKAQGKIQPACKDSSNPFFKSKYADLSSVWESCRSALSENGLAVVQSVSNNENGMSLITTLGHASGQWIRSEMPIELVKKDPQTLGSIITYYRRYALAAIVGVAPDDDDGEKAQSHYRNKSQDKITPMPVEKQINKVTSQQASELEMILNECHENYRNWVHEHLKKQYGVSSLSNVSSEMFERMKSAALKNMELNHASQRAQIDEPELLLAEVQ